jgi:hypothetical protein
MVVGVMLNGNWSSNEIGVQTTDYPQ